MGHSRLQCAVEYGGAGHIKKGTAGAVRYERRRSSSFLYMQHPTRERGAGETLSYLYLNNRRYAFISM